MVWVPWRLFDLLDDIKDSEEKILKLDKDFLDNLDFENQEEKWKIILKKIQESFPELNLDNLLFRWFNWKDTFNVLKKWKDFWNDLFSHLHSLEEIDDYLEISDTNSEKEVIYASNKDDFLTNNNGWESAIYYFQHWKSLAVYDKNKLEKVENDEFAYTWDFKEALICVVELLWKKENDEFADRWRDLSKYKNINYSWKLADILENK